MNSIYLVIGGNIGNVLLNISKSIVLINKYIGKIIHRSCLYETGPWGFKSENNFINMALKVETKLDAFDVLEKIHQIENKLGRSRTKKQYVSRLIDIDIIFYNNDIIHEKDLIVPHPRMEKRKFVLEPLNEINPNLMHPKLKLTISELLSHCKDKNKVELIKN